MKTMNEDVAKVFYAYPTEMRLKLLALRQLIFDTAKETEGVGAIEETLRWGEPSYLTSETKSGSMIRLHWRKSMGDDCGLFVHCQTNLIATFKRLYPLTFSYAGKRCMLFHKNEDLPVDELRHCIALVLTYNCRGQK